MASLHAGTGLRAVVVRRGLVKWGLAASSAVLMAVTPALGETPAPFSQLQVLGNIQLTATPGQRSSVEIDYASPADEGRVDVVNVGPSLFVKEGPVAPTAPVVVRLVYAKPLERVYFARGANGSVSGLGADALVIQAYGPATALTLSGACAAFNLDADEAEVDASALDCAAGLVTATDDASVVVRASERIEARASNGAEVRILGRPKDVIKDAAPYGPDSPGTILIVE